jgi:hypothetical protein
MGLFKKKDNEGVDSQGENLDAASQLKKIADHLVFLERKLDTILDQIGGRRNFNPRHQGGGSYSGSGQRDPRDHYRQGRRPYGQQRHRPGGGHNSGNRYRPSYGQRPGQSQSHQPSDKYETSAHLSKE